MLCTLVQLLNLFDDLLILFGLHRDRNRHATQYKCRTNTVVFGDCLEIGYLEAAGWFLKYIGEVLSEQTVEPLEGAKAQDPVVGKLGRGSNGLSKVVCVSVRASAEILCFDHGREKRLTLVRGLRRGRPRR